MAAGAAGISLVSAIIAEDDPRQEAETMISMLPKLAGC
jgi:thiamine monophosphate synthase